MRLPATRTSAATVSPGRTSTGTSTAVAGLVSYHEEYETTARSEQSTDVPICSSVRDRAVAPPSPTQTATELSGRLPAQLRLRRSDRGRVRPL
jgi:hypothetical protein